MILKRVLADDEKTKLLLIEDEDDEMPKVLGGFKPGIHAIAC